MTARWEPSPRRRRRNVLLLAGLVPSVVGLVVAGALLLMLGRQAAGVAATEDGRHDEAQQRFASNRWFGTVEHWVAPYNEGVASFRAGRHDDALADFVAALRDVPPEHECLVRHNIAVTREVLGDGAAGSAQAAMDDYRAGREALGQGFCRDRVPAEPVADLDDGTTDLAAASAELDARLEEKIRDLLAEQERLESADLTPEQRERRERLEEQEQRAQEREQRRRDRSTDESEEPDGEQDGGSGEEYGW